MNTRGSIVDWHWLLWLRGSFVIYFRVNFIIWWCPQFLFFLSLVLLLVLLHEALQLLLDCFHLVVWQMQHFLHLFRNQSGIVRQHVVLEVDFVLLFAQFELNEELQHVTLVHQVQLRSKAPGFLANVDLVLRGLLGA